ncbi:MAG TPA: hypothetical protein VFB80_14920 [Pirellulaceae bacterium]|nr:hypothetical protein [Pirellulaceae bacterium]
MSLSRNGRRRLCLAGYVGVLAAISLVAGCLGGNAASVTGAVTLDGQPLTTGDVSFYPDGSPGAAAYGQINAEGKYTLSTGTAAGLSPGKYVAVVVATKPLPPPKDPYAPEVPPERITPAKYATVSTSDLHVEVKPGANDLPLSLKSK